MYQENVVNKLAKTEASQVWGKLTGTKTTWDFLVNPETIDWDHSGEYSKLPVLNTEQPLVKYKYSESVVAFPRVLFVTKDNNRDLDPLLKALVDLVKPVKNGDSPELLKVELGEVKIARCYLKGVKITEQQWRSGKCVMASGSLEFILAPEIPKTVIESNNTTQLTEREQASNAQKVKDAVTNNKTLATQLNVKPSDTFNVNSSGQVSVSGINGGRVNIGSLSDILGSSLRPGLKGL
ncbi:hypothetical protein [Floridanema aerugineum]|uniref:Uncharacterized protein n=1 Tax=Floridaenema aerugineum BLCC-F46 TaxID=3153654 RepID=A0ABV4X257_9CYAN